MNLELSDEQIFLRDAARDALSRTKTIEAARAALEAVTIGGGEPLPDLWPTATEAGWPGLLVSDEHGGAGLSAFDAMLVMIEAGRVLAGLELLGHLPASALLDAAGYERIEDVASGTVRAAFAGAQPPGDLDDGWTVDAVSGMSRVAAPTVGADGAVTGEVAWVVDAPMFEPSSEAVASGDVAVGTGAWTAVHHAFTGPKPEFADTFDTDPGSALAYAYDIVCNGNELGGGSIRIHREDVQRRVFAVMGLSEEEAQEKFGFLLDAFKYGAPPHGGIAVGMDRICALLACTDSIRDVIAFPKSGGGYDPLTSAPAPITAQQRKEAGVDAVPVAAAPA
jgi:hypothetical protein